MYSNYTIFLNIINQKSIKFDDYLSLYSSSSKKQVRKVCINNIQNIISIKIHG